MNHTEIPDNQMISKLLRDLAEDPISYRHIYGTIDPEYHHFGSGRPSCEIHTIKDLTLLMWTDSGVCCIWDTRGPDTVDDLHDFIIENEANELLVLGDEGFYFLRPCLTDGQWRYSRNYGVDASAFRPRPLPTVRKLSQDDRMKLELAVEKGIFTSSPSTLRDFNLMAEGLPVICFGAFAGDDIVGFCSAHSICQRVQEISWIVVNENHRREGFASALLTAQAAEAFAGGKALAYHAGSAGDDLHAMVTGLGFREVKPTYRFIPATARDQWRTYWGKIV